MGHYRLAAAAVGTLLAAGACREHQVDLSYRPDEGDTYDYRFEITAVVTRALEGREPQVTELDTVLRADHRVLDVSEDGARVEVEIRRDGGEPDTVVVELDRAGSLRGLELPEGLEGQIGGIGDALAPTGSLPDVPLAPGQRWSSDDGSRFVRGRLLRLGVVDGADVAVIRTTVDEDVSERTEAGGSPATLTGQLSTRSTTTYDVEDGAVRRSSSSTSGEVEVLIEPPAGVEADPVPGTISYEVEVEVTRLR